MNPFYTDEVFEHEGVFTYIKRCGNDQSIMELLMFITPTFFTLAGHIFCYQLYQAKIHNLNKDSKRMLICYSIYGTVFLCAIIYYITTVTMPSSDASPASSTYMIVMVAAVLPVIFITLMFPPWFFFKKVTSTVLTERNVGKYALFEDPITRACLKVYLTKSLQQESMLFWEDVYYYKQEYAYLSNSKRFEKLQSIIKKYIETSSSLEINVADNMKQAVINYVAEGNVYIIYYIINSILLLYLTKQ